jgi:pterin-4a-carbinolamine dehydratase
MLISKTCHQVGYAPSIFNVYNRIVLKLSTPVQNGREITAKDIYMAHLLDEIHSKTAD